MSALLFILTNGMALWVSVALSRAVLRDEPAGVRMLSTLTLFPLVALLALIPLGLAQALSAAGALVLLSVVALAVSPALLRRRGPSPALERIAGTPWRTLTCSFPGRLSLTLAAVAAVPVLGRALLAGPYFSIDDLKYHAPYVTWWLQHGGFIDSVSSYYYAYYPFNAELFALWFVLPFGQDAHATLAGAFWLLLLAASLIVLLRSLGRSPAQSLLLVALVLSMGIVNISALRYAAVDLAGVSATLAAMALIATDSPRKPLWFLAGLACGLAVGSKVIFVPAAALLFLWILLSSSGVARAQRSALYLGGLLMSGSFWYLRNIWLSGNPVFPAALGPLAGPMPPDHFGQSSLVGGLAEHGLDISVLKPLLLSAIDWPWPHFLLAMIGVLGSTALVVTGRVTGRERSVWGLVLLVIFGSLLSFVFMPASGFDTHPGQPIEMKHRFLILPSALSLLCFTLLVTRHPRLGHLSAGVTLLAVAAAWAESWPVTAMLAVMAAGMLLYGERAFTVALKLQLHRRVPVLILATLAVLALWQPVAQRLTDRRLFERYEVQSVAWEQLSALPAGTRIASVGPASRYAYPLFGRHLTLHPVLFSLRGEVRRPLHELWRKEPDRIEWSDEGTPAPAAEFLRNLHSASIDYVYLSRLESGTWPFSPLEGDSITGAQLVFGSEKIQLWKLGR